MNVIHTPDNVPIALPLAEELTEHQRCGRACAWCSQMLLGRPSVDLGERDDTESGRHLFPRACPHCACVRVYAQLVAHTAECEQCVDNGAYCPASTELRRALREGRRL